MSIAESVFGEHLQLAERVGLFVVILAVLLLMLWAFSQGGQISAVVDRWDAGSSTVTGTVSNTTSQGCSDVQVELKFKDHNDALVRTFTFGAGAVGAKHSNRFTTHLVGLLGFDAPLPASTVAAAANAWCADSH